MSTWKKFLPDVLAVVLFAVISVAYFFPADIEGKILYQHDAAAGKGIGREMAEHREQTGEVTRWMNSVFSGMPTYQTAPEYGSTKGLGTVMDVYHLYLPENVWYVFAYLLGFYILLRAFNFRQSLAVRFQHGDTRRNHQRPAAYPSGQIGWQRPRHARPPCSGWHRTGISGWFKGFDGNK